MADPMTPPAPAADPEPVTEPANDRWSMRAAVVLLGAISLVLVACATYLEVADKSAEVTLSLAGVGVGALATLATTRLGGTRPQ
jgi:hypothetical protein